MSPSLQGKMSQKPSEHFIECLDILEDLANLSAVLDSHILKDAKPAAKRHKAEVYGTS